MSQYYRPLVQTGPNRPSEAMTLAGGWAWFSQVEVLGRGRISQIIGVEDMPEEPLARLTHPRADIAGLSMAKPHVMGILNVTPDSFSDGGDHADAEIAIAAARQMHADGAGIVDVGGESTRPGAGEVSDRDELARVLPVIDALSGLPLSIDTRKAAVAQAALDAGAVLLNDVSAMTFDPAMAAVAAQSDSPVCLMHAQGDPATMQDAPRYDDVLLDVYDFLERRITVAEAAGIDRSRIVVDPGIGFGKSLAHNLALLQGLSLFHGLGCAVLLGASRKRFVGTIGNAPEAKDRLGGSVSVALHGVRQGVQITRVHDTYATKQAFELQMALIEGIGHVG